MSNACLESQKYCSHIFTLVIIILTYLQHSGISYIYTLSHGYINPVSYHILHVSHCQLNVSTVKTQVYPPHVYHGVRFSHYLLDVHTVTYRTINPVLPIYYTCLSNIPFSVVDDNISFSCEFIG